MLNFGKTTTVVTTQKKSVMNGRGKGNMKVRQQVFCVTRVDRCGFFGFFRVDAKNFTIIEQQSGQTIYQWIAITLI
jgi:hypothetical protein